MAAFTSEMCLRDRRPKTIDAVAFEIDELMADYLDRTIQTCRVEARHTGVVFNADVIRGDFILAASNQLDVGLFGAATGRTFTHAILNPPYKKLNSASDSRRALRRVGIETSNLYAAFLALAVELLEAGGELVAITPRSFCNGLYFRPFRERLLSTVSLRRIHVFESRTAAFSDDDVLQENVIFHAIKGERQGSVVVSSSSGPDDDMIATREVPFAKIVRPTDPQKFIHVVPDELGQHVAERFHELKATLA
ncbi:MAG TPA: Eco57I restriction-modification methylase domain-containing protein, partial [Polyangiaceae bacterium]|nr:Eco57I restriction-modification methylase domain-containing protein [Polyangiaceae bacterium]